MISWIGEWGLKFDDLPKEAIDRVKQVFFDATDCALESCVGDRVRIDKK